jgi:hypothetical protein
LGKPVDANRKEFKMVRQLHENMPTLKREINLKEIGGKEADPGQYPKPKFGVFGVEMIEKEVKPRGNSGRVYLPSDWVGKLVKIVRID